MSHGPFGKRPERQPVERGGTNASTEADARRELDVPSLTFDNTFKGAQTVEGNLTVAGTTTLNGVVNVTDEMNLTGAANIHQIEGSWLVGGSVDVGGTLGVTGETTLGNNVTAQQALSVAGASFLLGGLSLAFAAKTANYTLTAADCFVAVTSGTPTITLPSAVTVGAGKVYVIKDAGLGIVTLATTSSQTIDGAAPGTLAAGASIRLVSDNANWLSW